MLQNEYFLAKIDADTAENEQHSAAIFRRGRAGPPRLIHEIVGPHGFLMSACVMFATTFLLSYSRDPAFAKLPNFAIFCKILNFANFWRARSRLYQNEILQENMRSTAFFKLYKICILLHRCNLKIFAKKIGLKNQHFL